MKSFLKCFTVIIVLSVSLKATYAQEEVQRGTPIPVQCGGIIDSEFRSNAEEQTFTINVNAGDSFDASIVPLGQLNTSVFVTGPTNLGITQSKGTMNSNGIGQVVLEPQPKISTGILGATGAYTIRILNIGFGGGGVYDFAEDSYNSGYFPGGIGAYTLNIGCTLRDGTVIQPGASLSTEQIQDEQQQLPPAPIFSGIGFPGLDPVDFSSVAKLPLSVGVGAVTPTGGEILGYTLDANANDILDLTFTRLSGNLNLGLVVLSADNKVVFQASLISSTTLNTRFTLPSAGQYTIGVFRIDLLPPAAPEATAFQVQGTLNP